MRLCICPLVSGSRQSSRERWVSLSHEIGHVLLLLLLLLSSFERVLLHYMLQQQQQQHQRDGLRLSVKNRLPFKNVSFHFMRSSRRSANLEIELHFTDPTKIHEILLHSGFFPFPFLSQTASTLSLSHSLSLSIPPSHLSLFLALSLSLSVLATAFFSPSPLN